MPARENAFHVEKHANDALHNPPRGGVTHTDREIRAASAALGRRDVGSRRRAVTARSLELRKGDVVVRDGAVVRVDADVGSRATREGGAGGTGGTGRETRRARGDSSERWKTMDRILGGGTAGGDALREARRAALGLDGCRREDVSEDDGPVVVPASNLRFVDGWALNAVPETEVFEETGPTDETSAAKIKYLSVGATIGRKAKRARANGTCVARNATPSHGFVALSFDPNA